jgi:hypothetical protein
MFTLDGSERNVNVDAIFQFLGVEKMPKVHLLVRIYDPFEGESACVQEVIGLLKENYFPYTFISNRIFEPLKGLSIPNPVIVMPEHAQLYVGHYNLFWSPACIEPVSILTELHRKLTNSVEDAFKIRVHTPERMLEYLSEPEIRTQVAGYHGLHEPQRFV